MSKIANSREILRSNDTLENDTLENTATENLALENFELATSRLVTEIGDEMRWRQLLDVGDGFGRFCHQNPLFI